MNPMQPGYSFNEGNIGDPSYGYSTGSSGGFGNYNSGLGGWGYAAGGGLGGLLGGLFGNEDPYGAAQPWLQNIPGLLGKQLNPYIQNGQNQIPGLNNQFSQMVNDPGGLLAKIGAGYQQSPGFQFQKNQSLDAATRAAAAGGMAGSQANQVGNMGIANQLANQDYNQYLQNALGLYGGGLQGQIGFENQGFNASEDYTSALRSYYEQQAAMAKEKAEEDNKRTAGLWSAGGSILGSLAGFIP